ncbi:LysE family translocator [Micromonospora sp. NPDC003197]
MRVTAILGFLAAVLPFVVTPGASLTLLTQRVGSAGRRAGRSVILGTTTGLYVHAMLATAGLSALVMRSSQMFTAVKLVGAVYLVALGIWTLRLAAQARRSTSARPATSPPYPAPTGVPRTGRAAIAQASRSTYLQALLGTVLNPKAAAIYLTLVPQFLDPHRPVVGPVLILATVHALLIVSWLLLWTVLIGRATRLLKSPRFKLVLNRITGSVLVVLGLRTALS